MSERNTTDISRIWIFEAENQGEGVGEEPKMKRALEICLKFPWVYCWIKTCASARGELHKTGAIATGKMWGAYWKSSQRDLRHSSSDQTKWRDLVEYLWYSIKTLERSHINSWSNPSLELK